MSGFDLVPVDGSGDPVHLPPGDTVLGRGPFLGVSDKRVSRHHGLLQNLNGQLSLKPTHANPCFVQSSLADDPRPLQRDSWHLLRHGDFFSLLPGQLIYKVVAVGGEERPPRDDPTSEQEARLRVSPEPDVDSPPAVGRDLKKTPTSPSDEEEEDESLKQDDQINVASSLPRRVLPAWMLASTATPKSPSSASKVQSSVKRRKEAAAPSTTSTKATPITSTANQGAGPNEEEEEEQEEEKRPRKKRRRISDDEEEETQTRADVSPEDVTGGELRSDASEEKVNVATSEIKKKEDKTSKNKQTNDSGSKRGVRTPCPFGKDCYRKNPLHRKEYKHTKKPARSTRAVATKNEDDGEDSEDDDSFINDDSEDVGDDSDYVPPDDDDSGKEDVKRLQREAKVFLKRKK
ncbi:aprataxin and PNK-like factor isoform X2 [Mugil cephalus]|uniref:aprataxin and PNK-like factor isoform X2 n=1 Tax=Mugil cephalus TaxID=48193 RepID=UPI001FB65C0B|nr:aprataxin and PNK-like factor isoform X2 [Mugil cephalus]